MATNRSRRLRKKMHIDEFQELGFSVAWRFPEGTTEEHQAIVRQWLEARKLEDVRTSELFDVWWD